MSYSDDLKSRFVLLVQTEMLGREDASIVSIASLAVAEAMDVNAGALVSEHARVMNDYGGGLLDLVLDLTDWISAGGDLGARPVWLKGGSSENAGKFSPREDEAGNLDEIVKT